MGDHGNITVVPGGGDSCAGIICRNFFCYETQTVVVGTHDDKNGVFLTVFVFVRAAAVHPYFAFAGDHHGAVGKTGGKSGDFRFKYLVVKGRIFHTDSFLINCSFVKYTPCL